MKCSMMRSPTVARSAHIEWVDRRGACPLGLDQICNCICVLMYLYLLVPSHWTEEKATAQLTWDASKIDSWTTRTKHGVGGWKMITVRTKQSGTNVVDSWRDLDQTPSVSVWGAILTEVLLHTFSPFLDMQPFLQIFNLGGWSFSTFERYFPTQWFDTLVAGNSLLGHNGRGLSPLDGWVGGGFSWQLRDF